MASTPSVQGFIMRWEKHKGLIFKMLHFCSLQLTIQANSNLRIFLKRTVRAVWCQVMILVTVAAVAG